MPRTNTHPNNREFFPVTDLAPQPERTQKFIQHLKNFRDFGTETRIEQVDAVSNHPIRYFVNEFWTSKQRAGSPLHEISYRACFKPQLPAFFIENLTQPGDTVFDPFLGRGTTALEAVRLGRKASGNDANPLSRVLLEPRLSPPDIESIERRLDEIDFEYNGKLESELFAFYHPSTLKKIQALRDYFISREASGEMDSVDRWLRMVATNRLTGHSPGFFSVYTLPPNQAVSVTRQKKINADRDQTPPERDVRAILLRKSKSLLKNVDTQELELMRASSEHSQLLCGSADNTSDIKKASVDLVVTSPPFLATVDYKGDNWLRCWFNNIDPDTVHFWQFSKLGDWVGKMQSTFNELKRIVKPGGYVAFEVGEVNKGTVLLEQALLPVVENSGFTPILVLINEQEFTKTSNAWGVSNLSKGTNTNRVLLLQRK
ncbi:MAG: DNA methyltransferase [Opitutales bacterium]